MGKIDSDYLWLHERPRSGSRLRRLALLLAIPLLGGAAWLTTAPEAIDTTTVLTGTQPSESPSGTHVDNHAVAESPGTGIPRSTTAPPVVVRRTDDQGTAQQPVVDAVSSTEDKPTSVAELSEADIALNEQQSGASAVPVAPLDPNRVIDDAETVQNTRVASEHIPGSIELLDDDSRPLAQGSEARAWQEVPIESGDTLSIAFSRHGLSYSDSLKIAHIEEHGRRFTRGLRAGDVLRVQADHAGNIKALQYPIDAMHTLEVRPDGDGFAADVVLTDVEHRKAYASGVIDTSFYVDALEAGLSDSQIMKLATIFGWDIDFALDIRPGDRFIVVYDELFREGEKVGDGDILAAAFSNRGRDVRAVRYTGGSDTETAYYSPDGHAMKKAFIRTPVDYTRISSGFNLSRKHPILNRIRRHEGTDYAAPTGTPVKATGNGRIVFRGRRGGYGNMVIIKHDTHLSTRYGHLSGFARGVGVGSRVHQGDIIGYVGMTGLATGPHLHYEFRVDGAPKDPETIALPKAMPLPKKYLPDFRQQTAPLVAQLDTLSHTEIARAETDSTAEAASN
ncbi:peptidoglycan DD-metalloendopeptidase family protein [Salinisphaera sp. T31B1]|uniref:OapA family protein n=1 Tax=Salinisphaera sp. T31B1 TaxID=727963 RepID=UPI00333E2170